MANNNVYASYNGSQLGFTIRTFDLVQQSATNIGRDINSIAAGQDDDLFLASANHLLHYQTDGTLITDMEFPISSINYSSVSARRDRVYAAYTGSQQGVTVRDLDLNQLSFFATGIDASGIAAGNNDDVYLTSGNHIYRYSTGGSLIQDMEFPIDTIIYTDVSVLGNLVFASYKGSQQGVTVRDVNLNQLSFFGTGLDANSIAAGPNNDVYLASANRLLNFSVGGTLIKDMTFPDSRINYTGVTTVFIATA